MHVVSSMITNSGYIHVLAVDASSGFSQERDSFETSEDTAVDEVDLNEWQSNLHGGKRAAPHFHRSVSNLKQISRSAANSWQIFSIYQSHNCCSPCDAWRHVPLTCPGCAARRAAAAPPRSSGPTWPAAAPGLQTWTSRPANLAASSATPASPV